MSYWTGLIEGFNTHREGQVAREQEQDAGRRAAESRAFGALLESNDPELRRLALSGIFEASQPGQRQGGLAGYFGKLQKGKVYPQVQQRMDEWIPDEGIGGGPAPPQPGSAAMSANAPVSPGSQPVQLDPSMAPPQPPPDPMTAGPQAPPGYADAGMAPQAGPMGAPPPPPVSRWKRRGTGVPTAEEIAESQMQRAVQQATAIDEARIATTVTWLQAQGTPPEQIQRVIMSMRAPSLSQPTPQPVTQWGVRLTPGGPVQPVFLDREGGNYILPGGRPLPPGAEMVRMSGGGAGGSLTSTVQDSPAAREQLIALGADPQIVARGTDTGYWRMRQGGNGEVLVQPGEYTPPPAYSGAATILDSSNNPTLIGIPRQGVPGGIIGTAVNPQASDDQVAAQALLSEVNKIIQAEETPSLFGGPPRRINPQRRDLIVQEASQRAAKPYRSFFELEQAARTATARQVTPRTNAPQGTAPTGTNDLADQILQDALEHRKRQQGTPPPAAQRR